ncbi:hypothetical protein [Bacillus sp. FSL K6-6540]|uniref:hypothetical protein n=1 Tax=Bacillus sp. FSL K6-6540 TaxID=2921512 RepID=UPI0030F5D133
MNHSPSATGQVRETYTLSKRQKAALHKLADAYLELSCCWEPDWEGPDNFGGVLDDLGVLPHASLDDAAAYLGELVEFQIQIHSVEGNRDEGN